MRFAISQEVNKRDRLFGIGKHLFVFDSEPVA